MASWNIMATGVIDGWIILMKKSLRIYFITWHQGKLKLSWKFSTQFGFQYKIVWWLIHFLLCKLILHLPVFSLCTLWQLLRQRHSLLLAPVDDVHSFPEELEEMLGFLNEDRGADISDWDTADGCQKMVKNSGRWRVRQPVGFGKETRTQEQI